MINKAGNNTYNNADNNAENNIISQIINYFNNYAYKKKGKNTDNNFLYEDSFNIDIYSPLFDFLIKEEFFKNLFTINIPIDIILANNLQKDYINVFDKINKEKIEYYSIVLYYIRNNKGFLSKLKIKFDQIKKLKIYLNNDIFLLRSLDLKNLVYL